MREAHDGELHVHVSTYRALDLVEPSRAGGRLASKHEDPRFEHPPEAGCLSHAPRLRLDNLVCQALQHLIVCSRIDAKNAEADGETDPGREQAARRRVGDSLAYHVDARGRPPEVRQGVAYAA